MVKIHRFGQPITTQGLISFHFLHFFSLITYLRLHFHWKLQEQQKFLLILDGSTIDSRLADASWLLLVRIKNQRIMMLHMTHLESKPVHRSSHNAFRIPWKLNFWAVSLRNWLIWQDFQGNSKIDYGVFYVFHVS